MSPLLACRNAPWVGRFFTAPSCSYPPDTACAQRAPFLKAPIAVASAKAAAPDVLAPMARHVRIISTMARQSSRHTSSLRAAAIVPPAAPSALKGTFVLARPTLNFGCYFQYFRVHPCRRTPTQKATIRNIAVIYYPNGR